MSTTPNRSYPIPDAADAIHPAVRDMVMAIDADVAAIIAGGGTGDVIGPASAVNLRIAVFSGTSGKLIADGGMTIAEIVASGGAVTSVFGRTGAVVAATNDYTWAQINKATSSLADIATRSAGDLSSGTLPDARFPATLPAISGANLTNLNASNLSSGTLPAARMPALTGDVTTTIGTVATTIANNAVTLAKLADIATGSFLGRNTAATGDPEVLSIATAKTMLGLTGTNTGDVTLAGENYLSIAGQVITANAINLSGTHVTSTLPVGKGGTGTATQFTPGSIVFAGASGVYSQDNANLFWDDATNRLGIGTAGPTQTLEVAGNVFINSATANLYLKDTSTGFQSASTTVITPQNNNVLRSTNYTSGLVGWNISAVGNAEFNNVDVRGAIHASIITYNAIAATAGTLGVFKSAGKLRADVTIPAAPTYGTTTVGIDIVDPEGVAHASAQIFANNDIVRLKDGLTGDTWLKINASADQTTHWRYSGIIMAGTNNVTFRAGLGVADYGPANQGFIIQTADQTNSPYLQMATHASNFTSSDAAGSLIVTPRLRIGNLNGSYGYATDIYGFGTGQYGTAGQSWVTVDATNGVRLGNNTTTRLHLAADGSGFVANGNIAWTTAGVASISGWTINATSISNGTTYLASGFDIPAGQVAWFGRQASGSQGFMLRDAGGRFIDSLVGFSSIYPFIAINDATRFRIVLGGLNFAYGSDGSTDSMGMKIWSSAGAKLVEFSDVQNIIAGWSIAATKISSTGIDIHSGASAALAFGTTPPTSASAGTGIWLDRTGLYGLAGDVLQAKVSASDGKISGGGGNVVIDANGIHVKAASAFSADRAYRIVDPADNASIAAFYSEITAADNQTTHVSTLPATGRSSVLQINANAPASKVAQIFMRTVVDGTVTMAVDLADGLGISLRIGASTSLQIDSNTNLKLGRVSATNATTGFPYINSVAGAPTGTPSSITNHVPMVYDTTNNHLYIYNSGWKKVLFAT